ncbi:MAG: MOSC domain-containing protein [Bacteroidota bacterium]
MKLVSIYAGKVREVAHNGRTVPTGIFKEEVTGKVKVTKLNIAGDQQADLSVHGGVDKAVYAYPREHYDFWKKERSDLDFQPGIFGENLSITGLNEENVCVGDEYKIGSVILSVTTPRMPCFKLGIKMNDNSMIKRFMDARKNGFYFKVLTEGIIEPGDAITPVGNDGYGLTIDEVIQLYTIKKEDANLLEKAIHAPNLVEDWKVYFQKKLVQLVKKG